MFKNRTQLDKSFYFINLSIIINIMPLIPSGIFLITDIFNDILSYWIHLYINEKRNEVNQNSKNFKIKFIILLSYLICFRFLYQQVSMI